jgi:PAS domain S-box-containing protein
VVPNAHAVTSSSTPGHVLRLVDDLGAIVWEADRETGAFTFVGPEAADILGYPRQRWLADPDFRARLIHPDDRHRALACYRAAHASRSIHEVEFRAIAADGRIVPMRDRVDARDHGAAVRGLMVAVPEGVAPPKPPAVEELSRANARADAAERRAAFLAEATQILASSFDFVATLRAVAELCVPYFADWCAIDVAEDGGTFRRVALAHADPARRERGAALLGRFRPDPRATRGLARALQHGSVEWQADGADPGALSVTGDPRHDAAIAELGVRGYMCLPMIVRDRTLGAITLVAAWDVRYGEGEVVVAEDLARRAAVAVDNGLLYREGQETNRRKDEFLASLSHELRTPLTAMLGWLRLLRSGRLERDATERALATIERNAHLQTQLIEDLLDLSRLVMNKTLIDRRAVDVAAVVRAAVSAIAPAAHDKELELETTIESTATVVGDEARLLQVVENLLSNAVKFTPAHGRVSVHLACDAAHATISVIDTGEGIPDAFLPYVFDHFRQAQHLGARPQAGLGLGLAIARGLVQLHGGTVVARSAGRGRGATFVVTLPRAA